MSRTSTTVLASALITALALTGCSRTEPADTSATQSPTQANQPTTQAGPEARPSDFAGEAERIVEAMDDDALAGAVIMGSYDGTDPAAGAELISKDRLAGIIVMPYNLTAAKSRKDVTAITGALSQAAGQRGYDALIGVDQEGGPVTRAGTAALELPPLMAHGAADDPELTTEITRAQGADLRELGFTVDFAPVADVTAGESDPAISVRSAGDDPQAVARIAGAAVRGYDAAGIVSSLKHFPGHGGVTTDSHEGLPVSEKGLDELTDRDLVPFAEAAKSGDPTSMMVGHIALPEQPDLPASLNPQVYQALREDIGYEGLITTDALNMGAVKAGAPGQETVKALAAGADLAVLPPDAAAAAEAVRTALDDGTLDREKVRASASRVVAAQLWQSAAAEPAGEPAADGPADELTGKLAEKSLTVLAGQCRMPEPVEEVTVTGSDMGVEAFTRAAEQAGLTVTDSAETEVALVPGPLLGSETVKQAQARNSRDADVAVAISGPWELADFSSATQLAVYDDWQPGLTAVAKYLKGDLTAGGSLPVTLDGVDAPRCGQDV